jgi:hypothetical protein
MTERFQLERRGQAHVAVCTCGWRSAPHHTAGLAGAAWDLHRAADHPPPPDGGPDPDG